jgi:hypothetical protein
MKKKKALLNERENHAANEPYTFTETRTLKWWQVMANNMASTRTCKIYGLKLTNLAPEGIYLSIYQKFANIIQKLKYMWFESFI